RKFVQQWLTSSDNGLEVYQRLSYTFNVTVTAETLVILSERRDLILITLGQARAFYAYKDLRIFCGVVHAEVYIAWGNILHSKTRLGIEDVMTAVEEATFEMLREQYPSIVGVGIGRDEHGGPIEWFHDLYMEAKKAGLRLTAHAGEATGSVQGPLQIRAALAMGVDRIGHGLAAQHDNELMDTLMTKQVPLEINNTSNVLTGCCPSINAHPLPMYLNRGLLCTMFRSTCLDEYVLSLDHHSAFSSRFHCKFIHTKSYHNATSLNSAKGPQFDSYNTHSGGVETVLATPTMPECIPSRRCLIYAVLFKLDNPGTRFEVQGQYESMLRQRQYDALAMW
ncbi:hypothetical protein BX600DRAFT_437282, partial [Xylariales sp. PMI_506]